MAASPEARRGVITAAVLVTGLLSTAAGRAVPPGMPSDADPGRVISIPAGDFVMGDVPEGSRSRRMRLRAFRIDRTEITAGDFEICAREGHCDARTFRTGEADEACNLSRAGRERHPMNCVSWEGARQYCASVGGSLPTEAMWEKAARGGCGKGGADGRGCEAPGGFPWGESPATCERAVFRTTSPGCGTGTTAPVGTHPQGRSPYGVEDMAGNVWEWVEDAFPGTAERVVRGGGYYCEDLSHLKTAFRTGAAPNRMSPDIGFRCVYPPGDRRHGGS